MTQSKRWFVGVECGKTRWFCVLMLWLLPEMTNSVSVWRLEGEMTKLIFTRNNIQRFCQRSVNTTTSIDNINFSDHKTVFQFKSTGELLRNLSILRSLCLIIWASSKVVLNRVCSVNKFVDNALPIMRWSEKYFGDQLFAALARPTFYRQFVGGDTEIELADTTKKVLIWFKI